jgi:hypothetical protein
VFFASTFLVSHKNSEFLQTAKIVLKQIKNKIVILLFIHPFCPPNSPLIRHLKNDSPLENKKKQPIRHLFLLKSASKRWKMPLAVKCLLIQTLYSGCALSLQKKSNKYVIQTFSPCVVIGCFVRH